MFLYKKTKEYGIFEISCLPNWHTTNVIFWISVKKLAPYDTFVKKNKYK